MGLCRQQHRGDTIKRTTQSHMTPQDKLSGPNPERPSGRLLLHLMQHVCDGHTTGQVLHTGAAGNLKGLKLGGVWGARVKVDYEKKN